MHKRYDLAGVFVIALLAATGGSTLRDGLFLQTMPPVLTNGWYLIITMLATIAVGFFRRPDRPHDVGGSNLINVIDALGVPAFAVIGMQLSLAAEVPLPGVVLIGMVNGFGGGILRDLMVGDTPVVLKPGRFYLSAAFVVCILFVVLEVYLHVAATIAAWIVIGLFFTIRVLAIRYDWRTQAVLPDTEAR